MSGLPVMIYRCVSNSSATRSTPCESLIPKHSFQPGNFAKSKFRRCKNSRSQLLTSNCGLKQHANAGTTTGMRVRCEIEPRSRMKEKPFPVGNGVLVVDEPSSIETYLGEVFENLSDRYREIDQADDIALPPEELYLPVE